MDEEYPDEFNETVSLLQMRIKYLSENHVPVTGNICKELCLFLQKLRGLR